MIRKKVLKPKKYVLPIEKRPDAKPTFIVSEKVTFFVIRY